ncbi:MAG: HAD family hydrolase [Magnetococcales bacterium]|nr:HAD family hydrolase [Magnetococcales bacterium]MBF0322628.1 HAD family hydrolase [Magnetococcales bacterium]
MHLALFDLDNTLLGGDSDYLWGRFLVEQGIVDGESYETTNLKFYQDYAQGVLDMEAYLAFQLGILTRHRLAVLERWRGEFMERMIRPIMLPRGRERIERHQREGDTVVIVTATNRFVTAPIAAAFGVEHLLATDLEMVDDVFTGRPLGVPCFQEGKVVRLRQWLKDKPHSLERALFYSDSRNDLPMLEAVSHPVAVDPDPVLYQHALARGWEVISFR